MTRGNADLLSIIIGNNPFRLYIEVSEVPSAVSILSVAVLRAGRALSRPLLRTKRGSHSAVCLDGLKVKRGLQALPGYPRVVPGADARLRVEEVDLALHCGALLCALEEESELSDDFDRSKCHDRLFETARLTVSLGQVWGLVPRGSVLRGVAVPSGVLPPDSLCLETTFLAGRVQPTVPTPCRAGGVRVGKRLFAKVAFKDRPGRHRRTDKQTFICF